MNLVHRRGTIALVGEKINQLAKKWLSIYKIDNHLTDNRTKRDGNEYHITIFRKQEIDLNLIDLSKTDFKIYDIGVGKISNCYYVIIYSPDLQKFRNNLPTVHFHITLGFEKDIHDIPKDLNTLITEPNFNDILKFEIPRQKMLDYMSMHHKIPRNFSKICDNLWGSANINHVEYFTSFKEIGITDIISLLEEKNDFIVENCKKYSIKFHHFSVVDRFPMTVLQMNEICDIIESSSKTIIHCLGGVGRTATAISGYLIKHCSKNLSDCKNILSKRKTILTNPQHDFLKEFDKLCKINGPLIGTQLKSNKFSKFIMMVGYPACGKSTLSQTLENGIKNIRVVNQDKMGRKECINQIRPKQSETVILDRCNLTKTERKEWLQYANVEPSETTVIFCNIPFEECRWRITRRKNHETIREGGGLKIIGDLQDKLEIPSKDEMFKEIIVFNSENEINFYLEQMGLVKIESTLEIEHIVKFPRTMHLKNMGSASRDDLIMSSDTVKQFLDCELYIEEKIDGANLGITIKDNKLVAQNRSHYVTSEYHAQFKKLDKWILQHSAELWELLSTESDHSRILYGEWVFAQHSIAYDNLDDYFVAFDMYDQIEKKFWSRNRLENKLKDTTIQLIPLLVYKKFNNAEEIAELIKSRSRFYNGQIEGVYIRKCNENWLIDRAKIVRHDFICGNDHWAKGDIKINKLKN